MTVEVVAAIAAGVIASAIALVGFGLDSVIEFFAAAVVAGQLRGENQNRKTRAVRLNLPASRSLLYPLWVCWSSGAFSRQNIAPRR